MNSSYSQVGLHVHSVAAFDLTYCCLVHHGCCSCFVINRLLNIVKTVSAEHLSNKGKNKVIKKKLMAW